MTEEIESAAETGAESLRQRLSLPSAAELARVAPAREERLLLLLSIFIGVISGLLVVSFRMAIEWLSVLLRGSVSAAAPDRG